jgi:hypothetical protein
LFPTHCTARAALYRKWLRYDICEKLSPNRKARHCLCKEVIVQDASPNSVDLHRTEQERAIMAYRVFRDARGTEWQTWDVVPRLEERRVNDRRSRVADPMQNDRRARLDRRILSGHRSVVASNMAGGWLCFAAEQEKRRLSPIPDDWQRCPKAQLEEYCTAATPARRVMTEIHLREIRS